MTLFLTTTPASPASIRTTANSFEVIFEFCRVTFGAVIVTDPDMSRPLMIAPGVSMIRGPDL
jgi:hypothetical protein